MALGVGLLFPPGADGRPCAMYIADLRAVCPACGFGCTRRYYLSARFYSLTLTRMEQLLEDVPAAMDGLCEQCDEELSESSVERWSFLIGCGDGVGLIHGLADRDGTRRWVVFPHEHLDVQGLPRFEFVEDQSSTHLPRLDERTFFSAISRFWNPKSALRRLLVADSRDVAKELPTLRREADGSYRLSPAPGLDLWIGPFESGGAEEASIDVSSASVSVLVEDGELASSWPDAPARWLSDLEPLLEGRDVIATASWDAVEESLRIHLGRFPVDITMVREGAKFTAIAGDGNSPTSRLVFMLDEIAEEAARTCSAPGDIARVELDRALVMLDMARPKVDELVEEARIVR